MDESNSSGTSARSDFRKWGWLTHLMPLDGDSILPSPPRPNPALGLELGQSGGDELRYQVVTVFGDLEELAQHYS